MDRVEPTFLLTLADTYPDLLARDGKSRLKVATGPQEPDPTTNLGVLYRIVRDHGGPIETARLTKLARDAGINGNIVGVLIHGARGPCLLPLSRGVVGLVGRDDIGVHEGRKGKARRPACLCLDATTPGGLGCQDSGRGSRRPRRVGLAPQGLAERLGLRLEGVLRLTDAEARLDTVLHVEPKVHSCPSTGLDRLLQEADAVAGDLVCLVVRPPHYQMLLRRASELPAAASALERLCWDCGLDVALAGLHDVWHRLGRTIGGGSDRATVRARLLLRGQHDLVALLDKLDVRPRHTDRWQPQWHYTAPLLSDTNAYAVVASARVRIALGVAASGYLPNADELISDGGVLWREIEREQGETFADQATNAWHRWARAEHAARRAALAGRAWTIAVASTGFVVAGNRYDDLIAALETVGDVCGEEVRASVERSHRPYPRGALAFSQGLRAALRNGLRSLSSDRVRGFAAEYADGVVDRGPTLLDAFDRRGI